MQRTNELRGVAPTKASGLRGVDLRPLVRALVDSLDYRGTQGVAVFNDSCTCVFSTRTFGDRIGANDCIGTRPEAFESSPFADFRVTQIEAVLTTGQSILAGEIRNGVYLESRYSLVSSEGTPREHYVLCVVSAECGLDDFGQVAGRPQPEVLCEHADWGPLDVITGRQLEVLAHLRAGRPQREIAEVLGVSQKTVETHRDQIIRRLQVNSTIEAIRVADRACLTPAAAKLRRVKHSEALRARLGSA